MTVSFFRCWKLPTAAFVVALGFTAASAEFVPFIPFEGAVDAAQVTAAMAESEVAVSGMVRKVEAPAKEGDPFLITISAEEKEVPVVLGYTAVDRLEVEGGFGPPVAGERVSMKGKLWKWDGKLVIRVKKANQVRMSGHPNTMPAEAAALPLPDADGYFSPGQIEELKKSFTGAQISMKGTVSGFRKSWSTTAPNVVTLEDSSGRLDVVFWTNNGQVIPPGAETNGQLLYVCGTLNDYKGKMQLKVDETARIRTEPLPTESRAVPPVFVESKVQLRETPAGN